MLTGAASITRCVSETAYTIRHSWATNAKYQGIPIEMISESLGHKSIKTTQIYLKGFEPVSYTHLDVYKRQPLLSGYATRLLNDKGEISAEAMETTLSFYSSVGNAPADG